MTIATYRRRRPVVRNAAALLRQSVNGACSVECACCGGTFAPSGVEVDHVRPIALGGEDVEGNVQLLCLYCHRSKTREEFQHA
ncbi:HNH endonuclease [Streptomyces noursei]|uniref:HNH endonuclease n=1 Tax=Streptomyces noursei TaxID=1971 RepID=UPI0038170E07